MKDRTAKRAELNVEIDGKKSAEGRPFQMVRVANVNERWPKVECIGGTCRRCLSEERIILLK